MALTISAVTPTPTNRTSTATTFVLTSVGAAFAENDFMVLCIAADNSGAAGAALNVTSVTDTRGNTYVERVNQFFDNGVADAGVENAIYTALITNAIAATEDVTITFNVSVPAVAVTIWKVACDATTRAVYVTGAAGTGIASATPSVTTSSLTAGDTVFGHCAIETNAAVTTPDADVSNGSWSAHNTAVADTTVLLTSVRSSSQYKTVTGTATQVYNLGITSADTMIGWVSIRPETIPAPRTFGVRPFRASVQRSAVR
jgi:hypothetical protein